MSEIKLLPCPFCSSTKLKIEKKNGKKRYYGSGMLYNYTASVRCNICHARGGTVSGFVRLRKFVDENDWLKDEISIEELEIRAIQSWNTRKSIDDIASKLEECMEEVAGYIDDDISLGEHRAYKDALKIVRGGRE